MKTYIIIGNTYEVKDEIKNNFNGKWDKLRKGWIVKSNDDIELSLKDFCENNSNIDFLEIEEDLNSEDKRELIQNIRNEKALKLKNKVEKLKAQLQSLIDNTPEHEKDYSFITQPILIGHHSEKKMRKMKQAMNNRFNKKMLLTNEINTLETQIKELENISNVQVKGDAESKRQQTRDLFLSKAKVGDRVVTPFHKSGIIVLVKINKKTSKIKLEDGRIVQEKNHWITLIGE